MNPLAALNNGIGRALRRLLELDRPVPVRSAAELEAEVERNYRWNLTVNLLDGAIFWLGASFASSSTVVPLFISKLTDSPLPIGLAAVLAQGGWYLPQLFTAPAVERLARKKPLLVKLGLILERLPLWTLAAAALLAGSAPGAALILFLSGYAVYNLGAGVVASAWQDLVARCFPVDRRGRFFGTTMFIGAATAAAGAGLSAEILAHFSFPRNFVLTFAIAAALITAGWFFLAATREPVQAVTAPRQSNRQFWGSLPGVVRHDRNYRRFLAARLLLALGAMGSGFVTVAAVRRWQLPDSTVGLFTASLLGGETAGNLVFGIVADRRGHKLNLVIGALAAAMAYMLAWLGPSPGWQFVVFALLGINSSALLVSGILMAFEFSAPERRPTYIGLANTAVGVVSVAAPLLGVGLAGRSYGLLFALSAAVYLAAFAMMQWGVRDPRHTLPG